MKDSLAFKILLFGSLFLNLMFMYVTRSEPQKADVVSIEKKKEPNVEKIYDLKNFKSSSYPKQHLERRLDRMYKMYLVDKKTPRNKRYTKSGKINKDWKRRCTITLRRILVINAHLGVLESAIRMSAGSHEGVKQDLDMLIEQKQYRDKLMDMSNFYARYLTSYQYDYVVKTQD